MSNNNSVEERNYIGSQENLDRLLEEAREVLREFQPSLMLSMALEFSQTSQPRSYIPAATYNPKGSN